MAIVPVSNGWNPPDCDRWALSTWVFYGYEVAGDRGGSFSRATMPIGAHGAAHVQAQRDNAIAAWQWLAFNPVLSFPDIVDVLGEPFSTHYAFDPSYGNGQNGSLDFTECVRKTSAPTRTVPTYSPNTGNVVVMWVADPRPGRTAQGSEGDYYHVAYADDGVIEVRLWDRLLNGAIAGLYGTQQGYLEICFKAFLEVAILVAEENWPGTIGELTAMWGKAWDTGSQLTQAKFTVVEILKDAMFSRPIRQRRYIKRLSPSAFADTFAKVITRARRPGPDAGRHGLHFSPEGYCDRASGFINSPFPPRPKWSPLGSDGDIVGPEVMDHPHLAGGDGFNVFDLAWIWGSQVASPPFNFGPGRGIAGPPYSDNNYCRPPAPGTAITFEVSWVPICEPPADAPFKATSFGNEYNAKNTQSDGAGGQRPPGMYAYHMGDRRFPYDPAYLYGDPQEAFTRATDGIAWYTADKGATVWHRARRPKEFYPVVEGADGLASEGYYRDGLLFDFTKPGRWTFTLTVPDHGGELALKFKTSTMWFAVDIVTAYCGPIACFPDNQPAWGAALTSMFTDPLAKPGPLPELPHPELHVGREQRGQHPSDRPVSGQRAAPVTV